jgi:hypothetical protein
MADNEIKTIHSKDKSKTLGLANVMKVSAVPRNGNIPAKYTVIMERLGEVEVSRTDYQIAKAYKARND